MLNKSILYSVFAVTTFLYSTAQAGNFVIEDLSSRWFMECGQLVHLVSRKLREMPQGWMLVISCFSTKTSPRSLVRLSTEHPPLHVRLLCSGSPR